MSEISVDYKYEEKYFNRILIIGITYLLINLLSRHGFSNNIKYIFILKCLKSMLEYNFSKGFGILECNFNNFAQPPHEVKQRIHAEGTDTSDYSMTCINKITSTSNKLISCR